MAKFEELAVAACRDFKREEDHPPGKEGLLLWGGARIQV